MTVQELIAKLQTMPPDLPVCVADWSEGYLSPAELLPKEVVVTAGQYGRYDNASHCSKQGLFVCLGEND